MCINRGAFLINKTHLHPYISILSLNTLSYASTPNLYSMSTGRATARRSEEGIAYVGANDNQDPRQDNQVPPLDKVTIVGKV